MNLKRASHASALDKIIEKYTATPRNDPEVVEYAMRQVVRKSRRQPVRSRRHTSSRASERAKRASG